MKRLAHHALFWPAVTLALLLVASSLFNPSFLSLAWRDGHLYGSVIDILNRAAPLIVVSLGMTLVIAVRGLDISVGAVVAIAAAVAALMIGGSFSAERRSREQISAVARARHRARRRRGLRPVERPAGGQGRHAAHRRHAHPHGGRPRHRAAAHRRPDHHRLLPAVLQARQRLPVRPAGGAVDRGGVVASPCICCCRARRSGCSSARSAAIPEAARVAGVRSSAITLCVYTFCGLAAGVAGPHHQLERQERGRQQRRPAARARRHPRRDARRHGAHRRALQLAGTVIGALIIQTLTSMIYSLGVPPEVNLVVKAALVFAVMLLQSPEFRGIVRARRRAASHRGDDMSRRLLPLTITVALFLAMAAFGAIRYDGFLSPQVFLNLLIDNAFLCIVAVGMTFVILSGGIDLSVGAVIALTTMISATLLEAGWNPYAAMAVVLRARRGVRRAAGLPHPAIQPRAVHRHARRHVHGARLLLSHQHRIHSDRRRHVFAPSPRRAFRWGSAPRSPSAR